MNPSVIIADEPLASLDASIKMQILNYLVEEWNSRKDTKNPLTLVLISHDIGVVSNVCNRVAIMYGDLINKKGDIIEEFRLPAEFKLNSNFNYHPYTTDLLNAALYFRDTSNITGNFVDNVSMNSASVGCPYGAICNHKDKECEKDIFLIEKEDEPGHLTSCIKQ